jgi:ATP-dependent Clp protease ATP-binding subunit ClpC
MTSNLGARFLEKRHALGFHGSGEEANAQKMEEMVMAEVKKVFNPEFLNRLDETIVFNSLTDDDLERIIELLVGQVNEAIVAKNVKISLTSDAKRWILDKTCQDRSYGARPLRRALQRYVEDPLSEALIQGDIEPGSEIEIYEVDKGLYYRNLKKSIIETSLLYK